MTIVQPYPFKGDDFEEVYALARVFCERLYNAGLSVSLPDGFRSNTKTYPDHDRSVTIIEVFPDIAVAEQFELAAKIYADVTAKPKPKQEAAHELKLAKGHHLELFQDTDGWLFVDCHEDHRQVVARDVPELEISSFLRHYLQNDHSDDFGPFLDPDDLP